MFGRVRRPKSPERVVKRASRIPTPDLPSWAEQCLSTSMSSLRSWQNSEEPFHLHEAQAATEAALAVIQEMTRRHHPQL